MNLSEIYTMSRLNTGTDSSNLPDATLLTITNVTYRDLINTITSEIDEDFFYQEWTASTVSGQTEYTFPVRNSTDAGLKKLITVSIQQKTGDSLIKAEDASIRNLDNDKSWYATNQDKSNPIFIVYDKSVNIFPAPTESGLTIKMYGISDPKELTAGASESDIVIPLDFHHLIVLGNEYRIYKARRMTNEKNDALIEYENEKAKMVSLLSDRISRGIEMEQPNTSHLS